MNFDEYRQLRAYARYDGIYLAILWTASFAFFIFIPSYPVCSMACILLALSTPFFASYRLWKFRTEGRGGIISFRQALAYCLRMFFNAALFFAIVQWAYMHLVDRGQMAMLMQTTMDNPDAMSMMRQAGYSEELLTEAIASLNAMTPLAFAATYFINNIVIGSVLSIPISLVMKKEQ